MLHPPDSHYVRAAEGWLELGNTAEAAAELEHVSPALRSHPAVLQMRCRVGMASKRWPVVIETCAALIEIEPGEPEWRVRLANALFFLGRVGEAREAALPAIERFPGHAILQYNLACYECQLGNFEESRHWLAQSIAMKKELRDFARKDPDLAPYWRQFPQEY
jgi:tetratricopeptide (TPR) repeat protein